MAIDAGRVAACKSTNCDLWHQVFEEIDKNQVDLTILYTKSHLDKKVNNTGTNSFILDFERKEEQNAPTIRFFSRDSQFVYVNY